jgi:hypothetical protein
MKLFTKKDEALKMAIEALEDSLTRQDVAINACKEALEQPFTRDWKETIDERIARDSEFKEALEQPAWQGLTDDEIIDMYFQANIYPQPHEFIIDFIRAIEQSLKDKNT